MFSQCASGCCLFVQVPSKGASSPSDARSCVSSIGDASGSVKEVDVDHEYLSTDQGVPYPAGGYYGYYYPGQLLLVIDLPSNGSLFVSIGCSIYGFTSYGRMITGYGGFYGESDNQAYYVGADAVDLQYPVSLFS